MINFRYAKSYCKDDISLIENYDKAIADDNIWDCHHRREMTTSKKQLLELGEYFNRPANELIFLTKAEHRSLHNTLKFKGKPLPEEHKQKMSESLKGKTPWNKGKHYTEAQKHKMSEYRKGLNCFNNGIKNVFARECPEGFVRGILKK